MSTAGTAVASALLDGQHLRDVKVIFRQQPKFESRHHFGSRLVFARDGTLFVNAASLDVTYRGVHPAVVLDL